ncbi:MAG: protein kinase, partial [Acidimicrobiia bacterium]
MPEKTAQLLGSRYLLHEPIARGGMAVVWRGTDTRLGRKVAVKVLHARLASDANFRERFRREAVSAASFNHPNIVTVFDTGESGASHFIVMELVEGPSLSRLLGKTGALTPGEVVTLLRAVLGGLAYAHERGVVHRDIKPANILLSARAAAGAVKLGDFGIARAHTATDLTATGAIIGTASYLAPEQAEGKAVDHRADLYSLACLAYRALAGRLPWTADNELGVALARTM